MNDMSSSCHGAVTLCRLHGWIMRCEVFPWNGLCFLTPVWLFFRAMTCVALLWCGGLSRVCAQPVINEIFYHPTSTNVLEEWVELYNPGTNAIDLTGWQFVNGMHF